MKFFVDEKAKQINVMDERWYQLQFDSEQWGDIQERIALLPINWIDTKSYQVDLPSVTTYLEAFPKGMGFTKWLMDTKDPFAVRDEAGQKGSYFHNLPEQTLRGNKVYYEDGHIEEWEKYLLWARWWKELCAEHEVEIFPELIEVMVSDLELGTAGTIDLIPKIDGIYHVLDWKSGKFVGDTAEIQVTIYDKMAKKTFNIETGNPRIVQIGQQLNKKGIRVKEVKDLEANIEDFKHTQAVWKRNNKYAKPKYKSYPTELDLETILKEEVIK